MGIKHRKNSKTKVMVNIHDYPQQKEYEKEMVDKVGGVILMRRVNGRGQVVSLLRDREGMPYLLVNDKAERVVRDFVRGGYTAPGLEKMRAVNKVIMKEVTKLLEYVESYYDIIKTKNT